MIDERMEELASLHVLGALNETEAREFKQKLAADPELQAFVASLSTATSALAGSAPLVEPPPQLRAKLLARIGPKQKMVTLPDRARGPWWLQVLPWVLTAGLAAVCVLLNLQSMDLDKRARLDERQLKSTISLQARQVEGLNQLTAALEAATNSLHQTLVAQGKEISGLNELATALQAATNNLRQMVVALQETNRLANLRIAMLSSQLSDAPKAVAVSLWDNQKQDGVFVAQNLKVLPADRDYQLWILDNGTTPVSAGVFHVNADGSARVEFKAVQPIVVAGKFAVTEEPKGGLPSPTLKNLALIGG